jgi:hypothetical protein
MMLVFLFRKPICQFTFGSTEHANALAFLSSTTRWRGGTTLSIV